MKTNPTIPEKSTRFKTVDLISKLKKIEPKVLDKVENEIENNVTKWHQPYSDYATGGLNIAVLMSPDGALDNFSWDDCQSPKETALLAMMPSLKELLYSFNLNIMASRLLKLEPDTFLHEHRDYVYLKEVDRYRLHIPVVTNGSAHIIMPGKRVHMERGYLWTLDPKNTVHSACNFGSQARIHIMIDCYMNDNLKSLKENAQLDDSDVEALPASTKEDFDAWVKEAKSIAEKSSFEKGEEFLLRKFCQYDLRPSTTYDLLDQFTAQAKNRKRQDYWKTRKEEVY